VTILPLSALIMAVLEVTAAARALAANVEIPANALVIANAK
jgi:hypothetical protein